MTGIQQLDYSVDLMRAILWQRDNATRLKTILAGKQSWYDAQNAGFWSAWFRDVFDLRTANDFGLAVWAIILGVPLVVPAPGSGSREVFGFDPVGLNFENGNFGRDEDGTYDLTTEQRRLVLRLRYYQLTTRATVPEVNAIMRDVFGGLGTVFVVDNYDMTATYIFNFEPGETLRTVLATFDLLPRPAAVEVDILVNPANAFGFAPYYENFENGNFGG